MNLALRAAHHAHAAVVAAEAARRDAISSGLSLGATWSQVGHALGMTRQRAHGRFAHLLDSHDPDAVLEYAPSVELLPPCEVVSIERLYDDGDRFLVLRTRRRLLDPPHTEFDFVSYVPWEGLDGIISVCVAARDANARRAG